MQIHPRTARRLLVRLAADGYIEQTHDLRRRYRATLRLAALSARLITHHDLPHIATRHVTDLCARTGATAHLCIPSYRHVACVVHCEHPYAPDRPVEPVLREVLPAHTTAPGRVLLAHRQPWRDNILAHPHPTNTHRTIASRDELEQPYTTRLDAIAATLTDQQREAIRRYLHAAGQAAEAHAQRLARDADTAAHDELVVPLPALWA
jgi:DNA-binding IclR family transcriptional regulator